MVLFMSPTGDQEIPFVPIPLGSLVLMVSAATPPSTPELAPPSLKESVEPEVTPP